MRSRLLLAVAVVLNLVGVGSLVLRTAEARPVTVSAAGLPAAPAAGIPRGDGTVFAKYEVADDGAKVFRLDASPYTWEVSPGVTKQAFAFNGTVPGPTIRVIEGDKVRIIVTNHLPQGTAVHWHGMVLPNKQDGVPDITQEPIPPGGNQTYEFTAVATGSHWYHSHFDGDQVGKGLYGSFEVVPHTGDRLVDRDYRIFIGDTNLGFVINGRTYPGTVPLKAKVGEKIRIRITDAGEMSHPFHLHGQPFQLVAQDGFDLPQPITMDTLLVSTAQTFDIVTVALAPGKWMFHCHIFSHMHSSGGGHSMTGLVTTLDVDPADVPAVPSVNGVPAAPVVPAPPVAPAADNPPSGEKKGDKGGGAGGGPGDHHR
jgi:manganese oxidase